MLKREFRRKVREELKRTSMPSQTEESEEVEKLLL
jgi:hypothetical protein